MGAAAIMLMDGMPLDFHFSLLENGLDFLISSLDHLTAASSYSTSNATKDSVQPSEQKRNLKYALLHLCSSIELIFKERLRQEHWTLIFKDVSKAKRDNYETGDFQSVTFEDSQERLINICDVKLSDKQRQNLRVLRERRNRIEHFGAVDTLLAVQSSISKMVSFVIDFLQDTFDPAILDEEEATLSEIRNKLGACNSVVQHRWKEIKAEVDAAYSKTTCPECQQEGLIADAGEVKCSFCHYRGEPEDVAERFVSNLLGMRSRDGVIRDGGEWPVQICPECGSEALVPTEQPGYSDAVARYCLNCGEAFTSNDLETCYDCGELYSFVGEGGYHLCSDCFAAKVEKD